ncbi:MAG: TolC family protein [Gemmatimonadales bacterium]|jgi:outer membrane protein TolC
MHKFVGTAVAAALCWSVAASAQSAPDASFGRNGSGIGAARTVPSSDAEAAAPGATRLTLAEAVRMASGIAPAVEAAGYRVAGAEARANETRAGLLPSLSLSAAYFNRSATLASTGFSFPPNLGFSLPALIGPYDNVDGRIRVSQSVVDVATWQHLKADRIQVQGSEADRGAAVQGAARAAALAYLRAVRAQALLGARQADSVTAAELLSLADAQVQAGVSPPLDATRARTQLAAARGALIVARNQRQKADIDLALALGQDPAAVYALADTLTGDLGTSAAPLDSAAALSLALDRRADLAAERDRGLSADAQRKAIGMERLPRLDLEGDWGPNGKTPGTTLNTRDLAVSVTIPLLDGLKRDARGAEQRALAAESGVRERDLQRQIAAQVRSALLDFASGVEQHDVAAQGLSLAEEELSEARERFASGVAGNIDLISAQSTLNQARDAEIDARFTTAAARVNLAYAAGVVETVH